MSPKHAAQKPAGGATEKRSRGTFTDAEREAMHERAQELQQTRRKPSADGADGEAEVLAKIAAMQRADRVIAERLHALIRSAAPGLAPRTSYGMPAYARDGKVVCFFQAAQKFNSRYATLGFSDQAMLDQGIMWPTAFALKELDTDAEQRILALLDKALR